MIIVLKNDQATAAIEELKQHFGSQHEIFVHNNRVAIQNTDPSDLTPAEPLLKKLLPMFQPPFKHPACSIPKIRSLKRHTQRLAERTLP